MARINKVAHNVRQFRYIMSTNAPKMLAEHDPGQTLLQQVVAGFLAIVSALALWIARLRGQKGLTEQQIRRIIREEVASEIAWRFGKP